MGPRILNRGLDLVFVVVCPSCCSHVARRMIEIAIYALMIVCALITAYVPIRRRFRPRKAHQP